MVQQVKQTDSTHASINFQAQQACTNEIKTFCSEVRPGKSQLLACLGRSQEQDGFGQACKDKLKSMAVKEAVLLHPVHSSWEQLDKWLMAHGSIIDRWGPLQMGAVLVAVALCGFGLSYCIVRRKFLNAYNVVVPRDLGS